MELMTIWVLIVVFLASSLGYPLSENNGDDDKDTSIHVLMMYLQNLERDIADVKKQMKVNEGYFESSAAILKNSIELNKRKIKEYNVDTSNELRKIRESPDFNIWKR